MDKRDMKSRIKEYKPVNAKGFWGHIGALWSLIVGLKVTGINFVSPVKTTRFPKAVLDDDVLDTYRGHIELVGTPKDPSTPKCITCMTCSRVCPSGCITIKKQKPPKAESDDPDAPKPKAPKDPASFHLNYNLCSLCSLCVQSCPVGAIRHSHDIYLSGFERKNFEYELVARLKEQAKAAPAANKDEDTKAA